MRISIEMRDVPMLRAFSLTLAMALAASAQTPGDAAAGRLFFTGKGQCTNCHLVRGVPATAGSFVGPDLSHIGRDRQPAQIEESLRNPGVAAGGRGFRSGPSYRAV